MYSTLNQNSVSSPRRQVKQKKIACQRTQAEPNYCTLLPRRASTTRTYYSAPAKLTAEAGLKAGPKTECLYCKWHILFAFADKTQMSSSSVRRLLPRARDPNEVTSPPYGCERCWGEMKLRDCRCLYLTNLIRVKWGDALRRCTRSILLKSGCSEWFWDLWSHGSLDRHKKGALLASYWKNWFFTLWGKLNYIWADVKKILLEDIVRFYFRFVLILFVNGPRNVQLYKQSKLNKNGRSLKY